MSASQKPLAAGCYRLAQGVHIVKQDKGGSIVICDYPLRIVHINTVSARLLSLCTEERTCEQLATLLHLSLKRVYAICEQLRWKSLLEAGPISPPTSWPGVSVIVPTYNRVQELERCLSSLLSLDYPKDCLEIVVVDDASTDNTPHMLQRLVQESATQGIAIRVVCHDRQEGVASGRNSGTKQATHDLIAYIDSDCVASPCWLKDLVPVFQNEDVAAVGGMICAYKPSNMLGYYEDVRSSLFMGGRFQQVHLEGPHTYLPTANLLVRRSVWQNLGGFAQLIQGEDVDFCRRLLMIDAQIQYIPRGVVYHDYRVTMGAFLRIRAAYATAEAVLLRRHPRGRRVLIVPREQGLFAGLVIGGLWMVLWRYIRSTSLGRRPSRLIPPAIFLCIALLNLLVGANNRLHKIRARSITINPLLVFKATLRGHLAYTYHFCRHLTRYYTLPLLISGIVFPPLSILIAILCGIVIGVDYVRLHPKMSIGHFVLCAILDDCAYEVGVVRGCIKYRTWKPLLPLVRRNVKSTTSDAG